MGNERIKVVLVIVHRFTDTKFLKLLVQQFYFLPNTLLDVYKRQELEAKDKEISRLNAILEKAFNWFPLLKEMLRMEKLCYAIGFTKDMVNSLLTKKEAIRCNGKVYSEEDVYKRQILPPSPSMTAFAPFPTI